jgi:hypothetical protein
MGLTHGPPMGRVDLGSKGCVTAALAVEAQIVCGSVWSQGRGKKALMWDFIHDSYYFPIFLQIMIMTLALVWCWSGRTFKRRGAERIALVSLVYGAWM